MVSFGRLLWRHENLPYVTIKVFGADLVVHAVMAALETCPKALQTVCVRHVADIFADRMLDGLVRPVDPLVCVGIIRKDLRIQGGTILHKALQGLGVGPFDHSSRHLARSPKPGLSRQQRQSCRRRRVPLSASWWRACSFPCRPYRFHPPLRDRRIWAHHLMSFAQAVQHEPRRFLANAQLAVKLHGRNTLQIGCEKIDANRPNPARKLRSLHDRSDLDRKHRLLRAIVAAMRHAFVGNAYLDVK